MSPGSPLAGVSLEHCLRGIEAALRSGDGARAFALAETGAARGFEHPHLLALASQARLAAGDGAAALAHAEKARELAPRNPDVLNVLGLALVFAGRAGEALAVYDAALRQAPGTAALYFNKAEALEGLSRLKQARQLYERVLAIQPNHAEALARLANLAALTGDTTAARDYATRALALNPGEAAAALALASADLDDKDYGAVLQRAGRVAQDPATRPVNRSIAQGLIGDAQAAMGRPAEAFAAYAASNATLRAWFQPAYEAPGIERAPQRLQRLTEYFRAADPAAWRAGTDAPLSKPSARSPLHTHVFLVGFPRSGTTLLEQVLAAHGDVEAMEERDCLTRAIDDFVVKAGGLDRLAGLSGKDLDPWRKAYWAHAAEFGATPARGVFIDKMPLNSVLLPLIAKLFPNAKILFALRDPRDVVLSCFRRRFGMSVQMYEFLTLEGAARYYDGVMGLAAICRDLLGLDTHVLRYEDMVGDFEGEMRKACAFLGLAWQEGMKDFAAGMRARAVDTPSAAQVARGLYTQGAGQWRAWRAQLKPVLPLLAPWVARFGYEEE